MKQFPVVFRCVTLFGSIFKIANAHGNPDKKIGVERGVPVILHCGGGIVSVSAYETLIEKRKDIPQLSYIAGRPLVSEYNEWLKLKSKK